MGHHPYDRVHQLLEARDTISSLLAAEPTLSPGDAAQKLFHSHGFSVHEPKAPRERVPVSAEELQRIAAHADFGPTKPSDKFLRIWYDSLGPLGYDPLAGVCSPALLGSSGVVPLTIIAPLPDICRHMSNLIVRAQHEVFLATNYWKASAASTLITDALRELSRRHAAKGTRAIVKIVYDRGSLKQIIKNHAEVTPKQQVAKEIGLPAANEIPNIDLEVVNYHRPALGTFHAKFMIADRKFAIVQSNNIQDNDNLEMATHLEGHIVDSLYDMALITWHESLKPPLPLLATPSIQVPVLATYDTDFAQHITDKFGTFQPSAVVSNVSHGEPMAPHVAGDAHYDNDLAGELKRMQSVLVPAPGEGTMKLITAHLNSATSQSLDGTAPECSPEEAMTPYIPHGVHAPFPIALVNRKPWGAINHSSVNVPQNEAWLSAIRHAERSIFIQSPDINAEPLIPALLDAVRRGIAVTLYACLGYNDLGELLPLQGGTNEMTAHRMYAQLGPAERARLAVHWYVAKDQTRPLHNRFKQRSCHIKLLVVDAHIGIQGSGNQDTQSWYHSQEVNVLLDSAALCGEWLAGIRRNQNTHLYGRVSQEDGIWRDAEGKEAEGSIGVNPGSFSWAKGVVGAVDRVTGKGGF